MRKKLLIYSDAVSTSTGLARITRELTQRIVSELHDDFEVATIGQGALAADRSLPWDQYDWKYNPEFIIRELPAVWEKFTQGQDGIFLSIQDANRMLWLADPEYCSDRAVKDFIYAVRPLKRMKLWGYFPVDGHNVNGGLGGLSAHVLSRYDRVLAYTKYGAGVISKTLAMADPKTANEVEYIPHGIDTSVFYPRDRKEARETFGKRINHAVQWMQGNDNDKPASVDDDALAIGIVATNQQRKDYGLGIQAVAEVAKTRKVFLWIHTDRLKGEWSILELLSDLKVLDYAVVSTGNLTSDQMAWAYSAMDVTLGIGRGEGFGFPIFESLACGVACLTSDYGGAPEWMEDVMRMPCDALRIEGPWNILRPIHTPYAWAREIEEVSPLGGFLPIALEWREVFRRFAEWLKNESD